MKILIKPLSVNDCWQGRRFKTKLYKSYENEFLLKLKPLDIPKDINLSISIKVGFSNKNSDLDNILKPFLDILQKKYKFNDNKVYKIITEKVIVEKGKEFIDFKINEF